MWYDGRMLKVFLIVGILATTLWGQSVPVRRVPLLREGTRILEATGNLTRANEKSPLVFEIEREGGGEPTSIIVLPNQHLAEMEGAKDKNPEIQFLISGDIFAFKNLNYLLVRKSVSVEKHPERDRQATAIADPNFPNPYGGTFEGSVEEIVQQLEEATGPLMRSIRNAANHPIIDQGGPEEGHLITARRCRVIRNSAGAWIAVFVSDSSGLADPPCTILPGKQFNSLVKTISNADPSTPVLVSGEILKYHGHSFLSLQAWRKVHKTDHLP